MTTFDPGSRAHGPDLPAPSSGASSADGSALDGSALDGALSRSVLYGALAALLRPPARESLAYVYGLEMASVLAEAAALLDEEYATSAPLAPVVARLLAAAREAEAEELGALYERLFGHTARGKVTPYETEYGRGEVFRQSQELADLNGFYRAFGLHLPAVRRERSDHVAVECEFLSFLAYREAAALATRDAERFWSAREAERSFLRDHLGAFGRAFASSLSQAAEDAYYLAAGDLLFLFLTADCEFLGVRPGPRSIELRPPEDDAVPMACAGCALGAGGEPAGSPAP
jgi:TorA maturation chaperone TorD